MSRKEQIKELLTFTKGEQQGITVLLIILFVMVFLNFAISFFVNEKEYDFSEFDNEIKEFEASLTPMKEDAYESKLDKYIIARYDTLKLFSFDPNTTSDEDWAKLGFTKKQIKTINNYRNHGGKFFSKKDFRRMYGMRSKQYEILKPYINLPEKSSYSSNYKKYDKHKYDYDNSDNERNIDSLFAFDPNTASFENWISLGFSNKQAKTIRNYVDKGGKFYKKEDLLKIYSVKQEQYEVVKDFIKIKSDKSENSDSETPKVDNKNVVVDLNGFTEQQFAELGGFWKYNASKIVKFRTMLGGFIRKEQLLDLYGMKKKYYDKITREVYVDKSKIQKIRINFAEKEEFAKHPYLSWTNAKDIVDYRNNTGMIKSVKQLRDAKVISQTTFDKVKYYLTSK